MTVDEDVRVPRQAMRLLAWATAGLLVAGVGSVGAVRSADNRAEQRIVTAAGAGQYGVDAPPPVTAPPGSVALPPAPMPTTTPLPTTVRTPVPTTAPPTTLAQVPRTTTTTNRAAPPAPTTTTPSATQALVTVANETAYAYVITVNGRYFQLAPGQQVGPVGIELYAHGNDIVEVKAVADPTCGLGDADNYFDAGGRYRMAIVSSPGMCQTMPGPQLKVTPA